MITFCNCITLSSYKLVNVNDHSNRCESKKKFEENIPVLGTRTPEKSVAKCKKNITGWFKGASQRGELVG